MVFGLCRYRPFLSACVFRTRISRSLPNLPLYARFRCRHATRQKLAVKLNALAGEQCHRHVHNGYERFEHKLREISYESIEQKND